LVLWAVWTVASLASTAALTPGCSSKASLVGAGGACELATDCENGLICFKSVCTSDLSGAQQLPPTPDAGGAAVAAKDATAPDAPATSSPVEAAAPVPDASLAD
jgi:hypothetical protein